MKKANCYPIDPLWSSYETIIVQGLINLLWHYIYDERPLDGLYDSIITPMNKKIAELNSLAWESGLDE